MFHICTVLRSDQINSQQFDQVENCQKTNRVHGRKNTEVVRFTNVFRRNYISHVPVAVAAGKYIDLFSEKLKTIFFCALVNPCVNSAPSHRFATSFCATSCEQQINAIWLFNIHSVVANRGLTGEFTHRNWSKCFSLIQTSKDQRI